MITTNTVARCSIIASGKVQQLATAQSMHSMWLLALMAEQRVYSFQAKCLCFYYVLFVHNFFVRVV